MRNPRQVLFLALLLTALSLVVISAVFALIHFGEAATQYIPLGLGILVPTGALFLFHLVQGVRGRSLKRGYRVTTSVWGGILVTVAITGFYFTGPSIETPAHVIDKRNFSPWKNKSIPKSLKPFNRAILKCRPDANGRIPSTPKTRGAYSAP